MISETIAQRVLQAALSTGGDFAEIYCEDSESTRLAMTDGRVENASYSRSRGVGIRVLCGFRSAYAYTADVTESALLATAKAAAAGLRQEQAGNTALGFRAVCYANREETLFSPVTNDMRVKLLKEMYAGAKQFSGEITQVECGYSDKIQRVTVVNSNGLWASTVRPYTRIMVTAVASAGGETQTGTRSPGFGRGFDVYESVMTNELGVEAAKTAVTMLHAPECPASLVPVVIDGGFGGVIFHEACGHSLEATQVAKGNSEFCGKMGQQIAASCVTAVDDGTIDGEWGSLRGMDDEGTPTQKNILIEKGILKSYLVDMAGARRMDHPLTGSSRRQDYSFAPTSRMTNTYIAPGSDDAEEMLRTMGEGLYAKQLGGGSVNPMTGEFNFAVAEGYWVRDGKIVTPVRGATLIGKGGQTLMRIDRVGDRMWMAQGVCGSQSGGVPVNVGQPRIRVSEMTVGGKGEKL